MTLDLLGRRLLVAGVHDVNVLVVELVLRGLSSRHSILELRKYVSSVYHHSTTHLCKILTM